MEVNKPKTTVGSAPGIAILGCFVTGILACIGGLMGLDQHQIAGSGVCFGTGAFAFGIVAYISFSK